MAERKATNRWWIAVALPLMTGPPHDRRADHGEAPGS
jgi:hypothetical protein